MTTDKKPKNKFLRIIVPIILLAATGAFIYVENTLITFGETAFFQETDIRFSHSFDDRASIYASGNRFFYLSTRDGIRFVSSENGEIRWNHSYSMLDPILKGRGDYAAVCDNRGNILFVFGPSGLLHTEKRFDNPILFFTVNARGDSGVILQEGEDYRVFAFDRAGSTIFEYVIAENNIMPLAMDISEDGRIVAISLLDINNIAVNSRIIFIYTREEGRSYSRSIFSGFEHENQLVPFIRFMANNRLIYMSDVEIGLIDVEAQGGSRISWRMPLRNKVDAIAFMGNRGFAIAYGEGLRGMDPLPEGRMEIYNLDLHRTGEHDFSRRVTYLNATADFVVAAEGRYFKAFNQRGGILWEFAALSYVRDIMFVERNVNNIVMQTNTDTTVLRRVRN